MSRTGNPWSAGDPGDEHVYNISDEITQICQKLGLYPNHVGRIDIYPSELRAEVLVYNLNEEGKKYVDLEEGSEQYGEASTRTEVFRVRT
jgi:hypothetical protein